MKNSKKEEKKDVIYIFRPAEIFSTGAYVIAEKRELELYTNSDNPNVKTLFKGRFNRFFAVYVPKQISDSTLESNGVALKEGMEIFPHNENYHNELNIEFNKYHAMIFSEVCAYGYPKDVEVEFVHDKQTFQEIFDKQIEEEKERVKERARKK